VSRAKPDEDLTEPWLYESFDWAALRCSLLKGVQNLAASGLVHGVIDSSRPQFAHALRTGMPACLHRVGGWCVLLSIALEVVEYPIRFTRSNDILLRFRQRAQLLDFSNMPKPLLLLKLWRS